MRLIGLEQLLTNHIPNISKRWLYTLVRRGDIPGVKVGSRWLFDPDEVIAVLKARGKAVPK